jgi:hypothetical protein
MLNVERSVNRDVYFSFHPDHHVKPRPHRAAPTVLTVQLAVGFLPWAIVLWLFLMTLNR